MQLAPLRFIKPEGVIRVQVGTYEHWTGHRGACQCRIRKFEQRSRSNGIRMPTWGTGLEHDRESRNLQCQ